MCVVVAKELITVSFFLDCCLIVACLFQEGQTALIWAATEGHPEVVAKLEELGADLTAADGHVSRPLQHLLDGCAKELLDNFLLYFKEGWTAAIYAAREGRVEVITKLAELGVDLALTDYVNPLLYCVCYFRELMVSCFVSNNL